MQQASVSIVGVGGQGLGRVTARGGKFGAGHLTPVVIVEVALVALPVSDRQGLPVGILLRRGPHPARGQDSEGAQVVVIGVTGEQPLAITLAQGTAECIQLDTLLHGPAQAGNALTPPLRIGQGGYSPGTVPLFHPAPRMVILARPLGHVFEPG
ncbi:hypothetical protein [Grimontia celer]|uniref:hypothetical protein n=1 Tax=Grimontia celer TaxID=1796497 RepID=UPI001E2D0692|nr:hypothetical protein [Grimontia celer]